MDLKSVNPFTTMFLKSFFLSLIDTELWDKSNNTDLKSLNNFTTIFSELLLLKILDTVLPLSLLDTFNVELSE